MTSASRPIRSVLIASAVYAAVSLAVVFSQFALLPRIDDAFPWTFLVRFILNVAILIAMAILVSAWVVRSSSRRGVILPLMAWWLSSITVTGIVWTLVLHAPVSNIAVAAASAATFRTLTDSGPLVPLFTLDDRVYGLGIPWVAVLICSSAYAAGRKLESTSSAGLTEQTDAIDPMPNKHFDRDSRGQ